MAHSNVRIFVPTILLDGNSVPTGINMAHFLNNLQYYHYYATISDFLI